MSQTPTDEPLPAPLTPPDSDLRGFPWMELHVERLRRSRAWALGRRYPELNLTHHNMALWTTAYYEKPAASLEDDDDVLADAAECSPERWPKVKKLVMRGWIKCADGRLYHTTLAEIAREAWRRKLEQRTKGRAGAKARWTKKAARSGPAHATSNGTAMPQAMPEQCPGHATAMPQAMPEQWHSHAPAMPQAMPRPCPGHATGNAQAMPKQCLEMPQYKDIDIDTDKDRDRDSTSPTPAIPYKQDSSETGTTGREAFFAVSQPPDAAESCAADAAPAGQAIPTISDKPARDTAKPAGDRPRHTAGQGSRLPADWAPKPPDRQRALTLGLEPNAVLESFRDYWHAQPGAKGRKADWDATWRTWCRREADRQRQPPGRPMGRPPAANSLERVMELYGRPKEREPEAAATIDGEVVL